jgi:hypothetical protein
MTKCFIEQIGADGLSGSGGTTCLANNFRRGLPETRQPMDQEPVMLPTVLALLMADWLARRMSAKNEPTRECQCHHIWSGVSRLNFKGLRQRRRDEVVQGHCRATYDPPSGGLSSATKSSGALASASGPQAAACHPRNQQPNGLR